MLFISLILVSRMGAYDGLATERHLDVLSLLSVTSILFSFVVVFGRNDGTELVGHVVQPWSGLHICWRAAVARLAMLYPYIFACHTESSRRSFSYKHWRPVLVHYGCIPALFFYTAWLLYSLTRFDVSSPPRCSGSACSSRSRFPFFVYFGFVSVLRGSVSPTRRFICYTLSFGYCLCPPVWQKLRSIAGWAIGLSD